MDTVTTLQKMRDLLAEPNAWTQNACARDASGSEVEERDPSAVRWDLEGAFWLVCGPDDDIQPIRRLICGTRNIVEFNDDPATTHAVVLAALDKAIGTERRMRDHPPRDPRRMT